MSFTRKQTGKFAKFFCRLILIQMFSIPLFNFIFTPNVKRMVC